MTLKELLKQWKLAHLWPIFEEQKIDEVDILLALTEDDLSKIAQTIGDQVRLRKGIKSLAEESTANIATVTDIATASDIATVEEDISTVSSYVDPAIDPAVCQTIMILGQHHHRISNKTLCFLKKCVA
ncbi:uncharacterized protein LOC116176553 [Photinus pyralis]|uniref:uncharacterized protein LOC116176553 n=1 Tax=Photinus pyralis TaxID=7054 RepID=UPI001267771B|nr:uncharacterized protein LOC116176553 [Photinus pyralis]